MGLYELAHPQEKSLSPVSGRGGWWGVVREHFTGAWQTQPPLSVDNALAYHAVFACVTLIASDISKLRIKLVALANGIWSETESAAFSPVLRKPNHFQTRIQFLEGWLISKLSRGNTYILKQRDNRGVVVKLYLLDPTRVTPLVAPDGSVFYRLHADHLSGLPAEVVVPASEVIHDRFNCLFHPLVGMSPLYACAAAAQHGINIQSSSSKFFNKGGRPSGILTAPGTINQPTADRLKQDWMQQFGEGGEGGIAVLGDGLKFEPMAMTAVNAQLIEQLRLTAEMVCSAFHVPAFMAGVGPPPSYNNIESLFIGYFSQALQHHIEALELCLDEGLGLDGRTIGVELDLEGLLRMDTATRYKAHNEGIGGGWLAPDEARRKEDLPPVEGGGTPYMQQQNYSLAALARRDANDPFAAPASPPPPALDEEKLERALKGLALGFKEGGRNG